MNTAIATISGVLITLTLILTSLLTQVNNPSVPSLTLAGADLASTVATTSLRAVSTTQSRVFATSSCSARTITTTGATGGIMLAFTELNSVVPSGTLGHYQAASTTQTYPSSQFGCGSFRAYSFASQNLTVSEAQ